MLQHHFIYRNRWWVGCGLQTGLPKFCSRCVSLRYRRRRVEQSPATRGPLRSNSLFTSCQAYQTWLETHLHSSLLFFLPLWPLLISRKGKKSDSEWSGREMNQQQPQTTARSFPAASLQPEQDKGQDRIFTLTLFCVPGLERLGFWTEAISPNFKWPQIEMFITQ